MFSRAVVLTLCLVTTSLGQEGYSQGSPEDRLEYNAGSQNYNEDDGSSGGEIPGEAGSDYPIYTDIPETSFDCKNQQYPGYYADPEAQCQVFYICQKGGQSDAFLCPNGTIFNQMYLVCDWWYNVDCGLAKSLYSINEEVVRAMEEADAKLAQGGYSAPINGIQDPITEYEVPFPNKYKSGSSNGNAFSQNKNIGDKSQIKTNEDRSRFSNNMDIPSKSDENINNSQYSNSEYESPLSINQNIARNNFENRNTNGNNKNGNRAFERNNNYQFKKGEGTNENGNNLALNPKYGAPSFGSIETLNRNGQSKTANAYGNGNGEFKNGIRNENRNNGNGVSFSSQQDISSFDALETLNGNGARNNGKMQNGNLNNKGSFSKYGVPDYDSIEALNGNENYKNGKENYQNGVENNKKISSNFGISSFSSKENPNENRGFEVENKKSQFNSKNGAGNNQYENGMYDSLESLNGNKNYENGFVSGPSGNGNGLENLPNSYAAPITGTGFPNLSYKNGLGNGPSSSQDEVFPPNDKINDRIAISGAYGQNIPSSLGNVREPEKSYLPAL